MNSEEPSSRRNFLHRFLMSWLLLIFLPAVYAILQYLLPPKLMELLIETISVAKLADIPFNGAKMVKFNKKPVILTRTEGEQQIRALSAVCTHLGCIVEFKPEQRNFQCNCHGSVYSLDGKNISGPAPRPLESFRVEIKGDDVIISIIKS